jgi:hypothetical protein
MSKEINDLKQQIMWLQNQNAFLTNRQEALRDHFAGMAMQALLSSGEDRAFIPSFVAENAYMMADAMLAEREKKDDSI